MQAKTNILLLIGILGMLGVGALAALSLDPPNDGSLGFPPETPLAPAEAPVRGDDLRVRGSEEVVAVDPEAREARPPIDPESEHGMISGRVGLATSLLADLSRYTIVVQEDVNMNARKDSDPVPFFKKQTFPADVSRGTPFFDIEDIPFSKHPYRVTVVAEGMNGSSAITYITAESRRGSDGDVQLALTPGSYFSLILRDQRGSPRPKLDIRMKPVGPSLHHRIPQYGQTDRSGRILFENVLQGDYEVEVGPVGAPYAPPQKVTVYANFTARTANGRPTSQGTVVVVPDGRKVEVTVMSKYGFPVENASVKAVQIDIKRRYDFSGTTDSAGRAIFDHVLPGEYQLSVESSINGRKDLKFKVKDKDGFAPLLVRVDMPQ